MSPEEFKEKMYVIACEKTIPDMRTGAIEIDYEYRHMHADDLMCDLLDDLGYGDGIDIFRSMEKWYA